MPGVPCTEGSVLHIAASRRDMFTVKSLIADGTIVLRTTDDLGNTPLLSAAENGFIDVVRILAPGTLKTRPERRF